jgi:hypothetical protein
MIISLYVRESKNLPLIMNLSQVGDDRDENAAHARCDVTV